ncbi:hypothetical protein Dimus_010628, partial [Dionaea muscipula]
HQLSELVKPEFMSTDDRSACKTEGIFPYIRRSGNPQLKELSMLRFILAKELLSHFLEFQGRRLNCQ